MHLLTFNGDDFNGHPTSPSLTLQNGADTKTQRAALVGRCNLLHFIKQSFVRWAVLRVFAHVQKPDLSFSIHDEDRWMSDAIVLGRVQDPV